MCSGCDLIGAFASHALALRTEKWKEKMVRDAIKFKLKREKIDFDREFWTTFFSESIRIQFDIGLTSI